ncbi:hypothetical protein ACFLR4_00985 [Bacteroidota bacterium]
MAFLLDVVGSFIIGGIVILLLITLNIEMTENSRRAFENTYLQRTAVSVSETLEWDFYKIGYNVHPDSASILWADSTSLTFCSDIDNTNDVDTMQYFIGDTTETAYSRNPNDYPLYRRAGGGEVSRICNVTSLTFVYFDESGDVLFPAQLAVSQAERDAIRSIRVNFLVESYDPVSEERMRVGITEDEQDLQVVGEGGVDLGEGELIYEGAEYQKIIKLKNTYE